MENKENKKEGMYLLKDCLLACGTDPSSQERPKIGQNIALCSYRGQDASTSIWLGPRVQIGYKVTFGPDLVIEEEAVIGVDVIVPYGSRIGARTKLYSGPDSIYRSLHLGADNEIGHSCKILGYLTTGNGCKIGHSCSILGDLTMGNGCKIGENTDFWYVKSLGNNVEIGNNCFVDDSTLADRVKFYDHVKVYRACKIDTGSTLCEHVKCYADKIGKNVLIGAYTKLDIGVEIADNLEILPNAQIPEGVHITATEIIEHYQRGKDGSLERLKYFSIYQIYERESDIPQNADCCWSAWRQRTPLKEHPLGQYVRLRKPLEAETNTSKENQSPPLESVLTKASLEAQAKVPKSAPESALIRAWRMVNQVVK